MAWRPGDRYSSSIATSLSEDSSANQQQCWWAKESGSHKQWLCGAVLAEVAAVCHALACVLLRRTASRSTMKCHLYASCAIWAGIGLKIFAWVMSWSARCFAPDSTVAPIYLVGVLVTNLAASPPILHEHFRGIEVVATFLCMGAVLLATHGDFAVIGSHWPARRVIVFDYFCLSTKLRRAFVSFVVMWVLVSVGCIALVVRERLKKREAHAHRRHRPKRKCWIWHPLSHSRQAVIIPVTLGLLEGATHFVGYVSFPWCSWIHGLRSFLYPSEFFQLVVLIVVLLGPTCFLSIEGAFYFDCRYFVPIFTSVGFSVSTVLRACVDVKTDEFVNLSRVFLANVMIVAFPFWISSIPATIKLPRTLARVERETIESTDSELVKEFPAALMGTVDFMPLVLTPLLEIEEKEKECGLDPEKVAPMLRLVPPNQKWSKRVFQHWLNIGRVVPLFVLLVIPLIFADLAVYHTNLFMWAISLYTACAVCGAGLRMVIFGGIGCRRMSICLRTDYLDLCKTGKNRRSAKKQGFGSGGRLVVVSDPFDTGSSSSEEDEIDFRGVRHFVLAEGFLDGENTCMDQGVKQLRRLLHSISVSPMAKEQIGITFALPMTGDDVKKSVRSLEREYKGCFKWLSPMPPATDLGEHILDVATRSAIINGDLTLVTRTTLDAIFHEQYFSALTFAFLASSSKVRSATIWQPPVFDLNNYYGQHSIDKFISLLRAQECLASLNDPVAVPLPASTYSVPLTLLKGVKGCWERNSVLPEHCGMWTKCWFTSVGRSSAQPIFLPVMRCSMTNYSCFPWDQVAVQARGLFELSYFWGLAPLALVRRHGTISINYGRLLCLFARSMLPLVRIACGHIVMSTGPLIMVVNIAVLLWNWDETSQKDTYSGQYLVSVTATLFGLSSPIIIVFLHLSLIETLEDCIERPVKTLQSDESSSSHGFSWASNAQPSDFIHGLTLAVQGFTMGPIFFLTAAAAEWYSALSEVGGCARRRQSSDDRLGSNCFPDSWHDTTPRYFS